MCAPHRNIARFLSTESIEVNIAGEPVKCLSLVFEFIPESQPLRKLLADTEIKLTRSDVCAILSGIGSGLARMHSREIWHDDLHDDNILVRRVDSDENLPERYEAKLIDFGSAKHRNLEEQELEERNDYHYFAKHIYSCASKFELDQSEMPTAIDRVFVEQLRQVAQQLSDTNVTRRNFGPAHVATRLREAMSIGATGGDFQGFKEMLADDALSISEPLQNTNALTLEPKDIAPLFCDTLDWQSRMSKSEAVIIIGPRGCGKTMLLRYLSIVSQVRPRQVGIDGNWDNRSTETFAGVRQRIEELPYIGLMVSAGQIRTPFLRSGYKRLESKRRNEAEDFCREFINLHFLLRSLQTLQWLATEKIVDVDDRELQLLATVALDLLEDPQEWSSGVAAIIYALEIVTHRIASLSNPDADAYRPSKAAGDDVLEKIARAIRNSQWASKKQIVFILDDYSVTVLTDFVQKSYNPALFRMSSEMLVRVSSEGDGPILTDHLDRKYREGRELTKVNLGEVFFHARDEKGREFIEQILENRFKCVGVGSLQELTEMLGEHPNEKKFGEYLLSRTRMGDARFHGFGLICRLCSGDVSFTLELLHSLAKQRWGQGTRLKPKAQDEIVKQFAQRQLASLRRIAKTGDALHRFAENLGGRLRKYLEESKGKPDPDERIRIEVEGEWQLNGSAQDMHDALLRYSVLISGGSGKSREGIPTRKLYFRRIFAPCFPFSPNLGDCIALTSDEYERWLVDPGVIKENGSKKKKGTPSLNQRQKTLYET